MSQTRINAYRNVWLFVFFDLPVGTPTQRKTAALFRKRLIDDGFSMMQFSVYSRHCASKESSQVHMKRVKKLIPNKGHVSIMQITDRQYSNIENYWGKCTEPVKPAPKQLEFF